MPIIFNNTEVKSVVFNSKELDKVVNDGVTVFEKEKKPIEITEKLYSWTQKVSTQSDATSKSIQWTFSPTYPVYNSVYTIVEKYFPVYYLKSETYNIYSGNTVSSTNIPIPGQKSLFCSNARRTYEKSVSDVSEVPKPYIVIRYEYMPS